jgi:cytochrome c oxidase assembly protein subunit 11
MLAGVFGRNAGLAPGYNYSPALREAGLSWSAENLDRWFADPRKLVAGARMPARVLDASARRDIIAYLEKASRRTHDQPQPKSIAAGSADRHRKP